MYSAQSISIQTVQIMVNIHLLYKAEKPSVRPSVRLTVTPVSQPCHHRSKRDLLEMKAESSGTSEYVFISLNVPVFIHTSAQKAVV